MRLGKMIRAWRQKNDIGLRELAKLMDVGHSTLSRIENGEECDSRTLMKIFNWLMEDGE